MIRAGVCGASGELEKDDYHEEDVIAAGGVYRGQCYLLLSKLRLSQLRLPHIILQLSSWTI